MRIKKTLLIQLLLLLLLPLIDSATVSQSIGKHFISTEKIKDDKNIYGLMSTEIENNGEHQIENENAKNKNSYSSDSDEIQKKNGKSSSNFISISGPELMDTVVLMFDQLKFANVSDILVVNPLARTLCEVYALNLHIRLKALCIDGIGTKAGRKDMSMHNTDDSSMTDLDNLGQGLFTLHFVKYVWDEKLVSPEAVYNQTRYRDAQDPLWDRFNRWFTRHGLILFRSWVDKGKKATAGEVEDEAMENYPEEWTESKKFKWLLNTEEIEAVLADLDSRVSEPLRAFHRKLHSPVDFVEAEKEFGLVKNLNAAIGYAKGNIREIVLTSCSIGEETSSQAIDQIKLEIKYILEKTIEEFHSVLSSHLVSKTAEDCEKDGDAGVQWTGGEFLLSKS